MNNCQLFRDKYAELNTNLIDFNLLKNDFRKNRESAVSIKKNIIGILQWFSENMDARIIVENMANPFTEVFIENGLPIPREETVLIDLEKQLEADCEIYQQADLLEWAAEIKTIQTRINRLSQKKVKQIVNEFKKGQLAIFMPGQTVQDQTGLLAVMTLLSPCWIEKGQDVGVSMTGIDERLERLWANNLFAQTNNVPETPYLLFVLPRREANFRSMQVSTQIAKINDEEYLSKKKGEGATSAMTPYEYLAMQTFFTRRASKNTDFKNISPLDPHMHTRFFNVPGVKRNHWLVCSWNPGKGKLIFSESKDSAYLNAGVRFSTRIPL